MESLKNNISDEKILTTMEVTITLKRKDKEL